ncbi:hypothetical protein J6590_036852 [Homalodisca vitripennis]|nr:hypothetical protein J6590_036852 [Homalodisca vitripennis]
MENTLVFKNGGVFEPSMPTINCQTCRVRRLRRLMCASLPQHHTDNWCGSLPGRYPENKLNTNISLLLVVVGSELKKLSEESLTRQPEEVFDIICKLGEG